MNAFEIRCGIEVHRHATAETDNPVELLREMQTYNIRGYYYILTNDEVLISVHHITSVTLVPEGDQ